MATPSLTQARNHYHRQRRIVAAAVLAVRKAFERKTPLPEIVATVAAYQMASATASSVAVAQMADTAPNPLTVASAFRGVSSAGFPISEPIVATIDHFVPAPVEPLPDAWWDDAREFMGAIEQLIASEVADAGRTASQVEFAARPEWTNYVRMLNPPSCARCVVLAGRVYRDLDAFARHPECDCVMIPVTDWQAAHDRGLISTPEMAFEKGQITRLSKADTQAIRDGADVREIINSGHGISSVRGSVPAISAEIFGRKVKATTYGTTRRARWRKANPSRLVRLRPESIYKFAKDHDDAVRLLGIYGYIK